ncbi:hypothetical protein, partial [Pseudomonas congelans]|uniref:hypothetical protein n=1 Tax=Pseudomonas congelans TaxID=200452 RepID=UPI001959D8CF
GRRFKSGSRNQTSKKATRKSGLFCARLKSALLSLDIAHASRSYKAKALATPCGKSSLPGHPPC